MLRLTFKLVYQLRCCLDLVMRVLCFASMLVKPSDSDTDTFLLTQCQSLDIPHKYQTIKEK